MEFHNAQRIIASDTHRFRVVVCGRKFGKTTLDAEEIKGNAICGDNRRGLYIAPTLQEGRNLMWDRLLREMKGAIIKLNETRLEMKVRTIHGGTSDIFIGSWEKVESYRGDEFDFILGDEVQNYRNFFVGWNEVLRATLTPRIGSAMFTGTPKGFNHFYDLYNLEYTDKDWKSFKYSTYDNPFIDRNEIEDAKRQLPENEFDQEYMAEFRKASGLVFKDFSRETHLFTDPIKGWSDFVAGVDFGFTNPTAIIPVYYKENNFYVGPGEVYRTGMTDDETSDLVASRRFNKVYPDPAQPQSIETMKRKGVNVREVKKGADSIEHGIKTVQELFRQNRLFIHESCINLITELEMYSYADANSSHNESEKPVDKYNHAIDALRYVLDNHSISKPIPPHVWHDKTLEIWRGY